MLQKQSQNKPNSKPIKPNLINAKMNLNPVMTKYYEQKTPLRPPAKQTQSNPISLTILTEEFCSH